MPAKNRGCPDFCVNQGGQSHFRADASRRCPKIGTVPKNRLIATTTWSIFCLAALFAAAVGPALWAADPTPILLWPHGAPDAKGDTPNDKPTLTVWLPPAEKANGTAVVICPGGGYNMVCTDHEGRQIAAWLNSLGVAGVMLDYRHSGRGYRHPAPLEDAQRAIRTVRARADEWKVAIDHVGIMGFSAGGHLASTAATHFDQGNPAADDPVERRRLPARFCHPLLRRRRHGRAVHQPRHAR